MKLIAGVLTINCEGGVLAECLVIIPVLHVNPQFIFFPYCQQKDVFQSWKGAHRSVSFYLLHHSSLGTSLTDQFNQIPHLVLHLISANLDEKQMSRTHQANIHQPHSQIQSYSGSMACRSFQSHPSASEIPERGRERAKCRTIVGKVTGNYTNLDNFSKSLLDSAERNTNASPRNT